MTFSYLFSKFLHYLNRPAIRNSNIHSNANVGPGCNVIKTQINQYSYVGGNTVIVNTQIGAFCSIASYCSIGGGNHPSSFFSTSPVFYKGNNAFHKHFSSLSFKEDNTVIIGNDVWIGEKVFIKDGIKIGDGAIIGAHSVITHDVPPFAIVGGVPGRIIRYRFNDEVIQKLLQIQWWSYDMGRLTKFAQFFDNHEVNLENLLKIEKICNV